MINKNIFEIPFSNYPKHAIIETSAGTNWASVPLYLRRRVQSALLLFYFIVRTQVNGMVLKAKTFIALDALGEALGSMRPTLVLVL